MNYQYLNNITELPRSEGGNILSVKISKKDIDNVTIICDYNTKGDSTKVTIKVRKNSNILEQRTFLNSNIFPKHIMRTKTDIIIYLESFKNED